MKTPEEIKKGLACRLAAYTDSCTLQCATCPHYVPAYNAKERTEDVIAYIRQLEANDSQVKKALQDNGFQTLDEFLKAHSQAKRERDAAVKDMKKMSSSRDGVRCSVCRYRKAGSLGPCERCIISDSWEWRGVPEPPKGEE